MSDLVASLRKSLRKAMLERDGGAVSALRSTLAAIENAGAVETAGRGLAIEEAPVGVGVNDVARRHLDLRQIEQIVAGEAADYESAASHYEELGMADEASALRAKARILRDHLA